MIPSFLTLIPPFASTGTLSPIAATTSPIAPQLTVPVSCPF